MTTEQREAPHEYLIRFIDGRTELYLGVNEKDAQDKATTDSVKRGKTWAIVSCEKIK